jgi:uncharacterized protein (DUF1499 family)
VAIAQVAGLIGLAMLAIAGPGYRIGGLPLGVALLGAALGFVVLILAFITGCIGLLIKRRSVNHSRAAIWIILLAGTMTIIAVFWIFRLRGAAPIHDITTDLADPPQFKDVVPLRAAAHALNPTEYQRAQSMMGREIDVPAEQRKAFPNLRPLIVPQAPAQALQLAEQAVRKMGWDVVVVVPSEGRIEATDTTFYFGFKDDVVIRVRSEQNGSRVDMRSESRVGGGDAGTNARRIRKCLAELRKLAGM